MFDIFIHFISFCSLSIADPNPFANILNSSANANAQLPLLNFQFNPLATIPMNPIPPPPIPPFAFTPPPQIPQNLEQLTDEELRILEGNERRSVEERIKVCIKILAFFTSLKES